MGTWNAYGNQDWPADYLIDARGPGSLRDRRRGRLRQDRNRDPRAARRSAAASVGGTRPSARAWSCPRARPRRRPTSAPTAPKAGSRSPRPAARLRRPGHRRARAQRVRLQRPLADRRTARRSACREPAIDVEFEAKHVYLVLSSPQRSARCRCRCCSTGTRSPPRDAGADVHDGVVTVRRPAPLLARLAPRPTNATACPCASRPGVSGYAFTFG